MWVETRLEVFLHTLQQSGFCFLSLPQGDLLGHGDVSVKMLRFLDLVQTLSAELCRWDASLSECQRRLWTTTDGVSFVAKATGLSKTLEETATAFGVFSHTRTNAHMWEHLAWCKLFLHTCVTVFTVNYCLTLEKSGGSPPTFNWHICWTRTILLILLIC